MTLGDGMQSLVPRAYRSKPPCSNAQLRRHYRCAIAASELSPHASHCVWVAAPQAGVFFDPTSSPAVSQVAPVAERYVLSGEVSCSFQFLFTGLRFAA